MLARVLLHVPTRVFLHVLPREEHMCYIAKSNMCSMLALGMAMWLGWGNIFHIDRGSIQKKYGSIQFFPKDVPPPPPIWESLFREKIEGLLCILGHKEHFRLKGTFLVNIFTKS